MKTEPFKFVYRIHNCDTNRVHNVSEKFVLSWLKVEMKEKNPQEKLQYFKETCFKKGHLKFETGMVKGDSYLIMTKETC